MAMGRNLEIKALLECRKIEIITLWNEGHSCRAICQRLSIPCSRDTLLAYLKQWGVDTSHKHLPQWWGVEADRAEAILALRAQGKTQREIAAIFNVSRERIKQIEQGIKRKRPDGNP